jgi:hypothetical protein
VPRRRNIKDDERDDSILQFVIRSREYGSKKLMPAVAAKCGFQYRSGIIGNAREEVKDTGGGIFAILQNLV